MLIHRGRERGHASIELRLFKIQEFLSMSSELLNRLEKMFRLGSDMIFRRNGRTGLLDEVIYRLNLAVRPSRNLEFAALELQHGDTNTQLLARLFHGQMETARDITKRELRDARPQP